MYQHSIILLWYNILESEMMLQSPSRLLSHGNNLSHWSLVSCFNRSSLCHSAVFEYCCVRLYVLTWYYEKELLLPVLHHHYLIDP